MTKCSECDHLDLCLMCRTLKDRLAPDGEYREIVGCDEDRFFYGEEIPRTGRKHP